MTATYQTNPRSCEYLASLGIEPNRIPVDGWDATGYERVRGEGPYGDVRQGRDRVPWPEGFDYQKLLTLWAEDEPSRRPWRDPVIEGDA